MKMTENIRKEPEDILDWIKKSGLKNEILQIKAKALLKELDSSLSEQPIHWTYSPLGLVRNITGAMMQLEEASKGGSINSDAFRTATLTVARAWESLGKLEESASRRTAFLNSAICYEMSGYQANALSMSRQIHRRFDIDERLSVELLVSAFLQRLFLLTKEFSIKALTEPKVIHTLEESMRTVGLAMTARGLMDASTFFLSGKDSIDSARGSFEKASKHYATTGSFFESNLLKDLSTLIPILKSKSTWNIIGSTFKGNKKWERYLKLLARGTGEDLLRSPSISELWPSQITALENGLLSDLNKVIRMPTSAGKTRVAEIAMIYTLLKSSGCKVIYTAPYRALVYEIQQNFANLFGDLGLKVSSLTGSYETDEFEQAIAKGTDILVTTPEKLDLLLRVNNDLLRSVKLFIMDEGQIISDRTRGTRFELLVTRLKRKFPEIRFLFLSAVVSDQTLQDFAEWFNVKDTGVVQSDWRPSIQRYAQFLWSGKNGQIRYVPDPDLESQLGSSEFVPKVIKERQYTYKNTRTNRMNSRTFPDPQNKGETAAELAIRFAELGPVLVFCSQTNFADSVAAKINDRINLSMNIGEDLPAHFAKTNSVRSFSSAKEWLGTGHPLISILKRNIAVHHGNIPDQVRKAIEQDFRDRKIRIIVATNTLAQGVNLPIKTVVVHSVWRSNASESRERISSNDYWNIAGRAGRAGHETEGTIIHIVLNSQDNKDFQYYNETRNKVEPLVSGLFQQLKEFVDSRLSPENLKARLDPDVLAMVVEEGENLFSQESMKSLLDSSLLSIQAKRSGLSIEPVRNIMFELGLDIEKSADFKELSAFSTTGLSTSSCKEISAYIDNNGDRVNQLMHGASSNDIEKIVDLLLESIQGIEEMQPNNSYPGDISLLLKNWIKGEEIEGLISSSDENIEPAEMAKFIEDLFVHKFPWGFSAFTRIARSKLSLENKDVSSYFKFFPTMIKFGVPTPHAAWAIESGIPFRKTSIRIAAAYNKNNKESDYQSFQEWLGDLTSEDLLHEFKIEQSILEDTSRAISQSTVNDVLKEFSDTRDILPIDIDVKGIEYESRVLVALEAYIGNEVDLIRDYDNLNDRNSIKIMLAGRELGFVPRRYAQLFAPDIDSGLQLFGVIINKTDEKIPRVMIRVNSSH